MRHALLQQVRTRALPSRESAHTILTLEPERASPASSGSLLCALHQTLCPEWIRTSASLPHLILSLAVRSYGKPSSLSVLFWPRSITSPASGRAFP
ncbi:MAG: hypothetical protein B6A08_05500 [Sorangiineae bacterium NIC37A_2]|nr:MAG: hypothetical protein B6A08_05500 [Sorangiineae bacterium NIC37A_2]